MPSKLSIQILKVVQREELLAFIRDSKPSVWKILPDDPAFVQAAKAASPNSLIIGRHWVQNQPLDDPPRNAEDFFGLLRGRDDWPYIDTWEGYNEISTYGWPNILNQAVFDKRLAQLLHAEGKKYVACSWGVGHPPKYENDPPLWHWVEFPQVLEALAETDYIGTHEYTWPNLDNEHWKTWHLFRFTHWYHLLPPECQKPIIITEFGLDRGVDGTQYMGQGWRDANISPEEFMRQLRWADMEYRKFAYILGVTIFCAGIHLGHWDRFDIMGRVLQLLKGYNVQELSQSDPTLPGVKVVDLRGQLAVHPTKSYTTRSLSDINQIVIHHSDSSPNTSPQAIARYHVENKDWPGIGYHFCFGADGTIYQTNNLETIAYHAGDWDVNTESLGVCLIGRLVENAPTQAQLTSLKWLMEQYPYEVKGHDDIVPTACPGDWLDAWLAPTPPTPDLEQRIIELEAQLATVQQDSIELKGNIGTKAEEIRQTTEEIQALVD